MVSEFVFGNSLVGGPGTRTGNSYFRRFSERGSVPRDAPEVVRANNALDAAIAHEGECRLLTKVGFMQPFRCGVNNVADRMVRQLNRDALNCEPILFSRRDSA